MDLKALRDRLASLHAELVTINEQADPETGFSEDQQAEYDRLQAAFDSCKAHSQRLEKLQEEERGLVRRVSEASGATEQTETSSADPDTFPSLGVFLQAVANAANPANFGRADPRLETLAVSGLGEGRGSEGGFLVSTDQASGLLEKTYQNTAVIRGGPGFPGVDVMPISANSNSLKVNAINETSRATGSRWGGVRAYWQEEGGTKTASKPDFRQVTLVLKKLIGLCYATDELLEDAVAMESVIQSAFVQEFAFAIQDAVINGTGAGQPLGILRSPALVSVPKETGQTPATIIKENIDKMFSRMYAPSLPRAVWLINQDCYPQLFALTQAVGTGGMPVYLPPGGLSEAPYGTLMGRPVVPIEQCQTVGTEGDIYFVDLSEYVFIDKGGIDQASSIHVKFTTDETTFRFVYRCDGQPKWNSVLTPFKGGATKTQSPFVALAVRD